jgi:hypothetical protein
MTRKTSITAALVALAVAAPSATAMPIEPLGAHAGTKSITSQDLRSPDARDAGVVAWRPFVANDLRTPDAVDGTRSTAPVLTDLRTPDAVEGTGTTTPEVTLVEVPQPAPSATGVDWQDAGLGAGMALALALVALGGAYAVSKHRTVSIG